MLIYQRMPKGGRWEGGEKSGLLNFRWGQGGGVVDCCSPKV